MATEKIAWAITVQNSVALLHPEYQSPPYTSDEVRFVDLSISKEEQVFVIALKNSDTELHYSNLTFPPQWKSAEIEVNEADDYPEDYEPPKDAVPLETGSLQAVRIDVGPNGIGYLVFNDGRLGQFDLPSEKSKDPIVWAQVDGVSGVSQVSAAPDGLVWVVARDSERGSVVRFQNPKNGEWKTVAGINDARRVTGRQNGGAYVVDGGGSIKEVSPKGVVERTLNFDHGGARELSVGAGDRLWVTSSHPSISAGALKVYHTDNEGTDWQEVDGSGVLYLDAGQITSGFK
ncbi:MAG: hypothetical protein JXR03_19865 [Cyclobacteriaceae bacterium]